MHNLLQQFVVNAPIDANSVIESERGIECEPLEVWIGVYVYLTVLAFCQQLFDADVAFEVDDWHIRLHGGPVQRSGSGLASKFA